MNLPAHAPTCGFLTHEGTAWYLGLPSQRRYWLSNS